MPASYLVVFLQQVSVDVGPVPLWSTSKLFMVLHRGKSWLGLYAKVHFEKHYLVREKKKKENIEFSFSSGTSTRASVDCLFKTQT